MIPKKKQRIGQVIDAYWDDRINAIRFTISFDHWGAKMQGTCRSGIDPTTGDYVSPHELKQKVKQFTNMVVYDQTGEYSPDRKPSAEQLRKFRFNISLKSNRIAVSHSDYKPGVNAFIRNLFV